MKEKNRRPKVLGGAANRLYHIYLKTARDRNLDFELTKEKFKMLISSCCYYCNIIPSKKIIYSKDEYLYNGIDRLDNMRGYTEKNSVPCCEDCNKAKRMMTEQEFIEWINRVYNHYIINKEL